MKLYADENFPWRTVEELRKLGHDVLTAFEDERANQEISDIEVLARSIELERAVLTLDRRDFKRLHRSDSNHAGIIICTDNPNRVEQAQRINEKIRQFENLIGQLVRVYRPDK